MSSIYPCADCGANCPPRPLCAAGCGQPVCDDCYLRHCEEGCTNDTPQPQQTPVSRPWGWAPTGTAHTYGPYETVKRVEGWAARLTANHGTWEAGRTAAEALGALYIRLWRERQYALDAITARYVDAYHAGAQPRIEDYVRAHPQYTRELLEFAVYWHTIGFDAATAVDDSAGDGTVELSEAGRRALAAIRAQRDEGQM